MASIDVAEHIAAIRREGGRIVTAVTGADLDAIVPSCPEWTVRELVHHAGRVHMWAATFVERGLTEQMTDAEEDASWGSMPADGDITAWYGGSYERLAKALDAASADLKCWTFLAAPTPRQFWARRQAHEITIHRVDAQLGAGVPVDAVSTDFALDGIDELLCVFLGRYPNRRRSETPRTLAVYATDSGDAWVVRMGPDGTRGEHGSAVDADFTVRGTANDLYQALWNRRTLTDLDSDGDPAVATLWSQTATIRWT